jgi:hypothetical protein
VEEQRRPPEGQRQREELNQEIANFIADIIYEYISSRLGKKLVECYIDVRFNGFSVEVSVDIGASPLVGEEELSKIADEASELGIAVADMVKEGLNLGVDKRRVLREALRRLKGVQEDSDNYT